MLAPGFAQRAIRPLSHIQAYLALARPSVALRGLYARPPPPRVLPGGRGLASGLVDPNACMIL